jgi:hypothetical protein
LRIVTEKAWEKIKAEAFANAKPQAPKYGRSFKIPEKSRRRVCELVGNNPKTPAQLFDFWATISEIVPESKGVKCVIDFEAGQVPVVREVLE